MATGEDWQVPAVLDVLRRARDVGETRSRSQLQDEVGIGAGDLEAALDALRTAGEVRNPTPDEFEATGGVEGSDEPAPARSNESDAEAVREGAFGEPAPREDGPLLPGFASELDAAARRLARAPEDRETVLSRAMVESLDPEALGKLVLAGVQGEDGAFVLRVEP